MREEEEAPEGHGLEQWNERKQNPISNSGMLVLPGTFKSFACYMPSRAVRDCKWCSITTAEILTADATYGGWACMILLQLEGICNHINT
jgi:hypothetical protein